MPQCKGCKEIVSSLEVKEGLCNSCRENGVPVPKVEATQRKEDRENALIGYVIMAVIAFVFYLWVTTGTKHHVESETTYTSSESETNYYKSEQTVVDVIEEGKTYETKRSTIGCEDMNKLYVAIKAYRHGGLNALMPLVKSAGCLWLPNTKVMLVKKTDFAYKVYFNNSEGRSRYLWVDERELK